MLILDEPSASLDLVCKEEIKSFLTLYLKAGGTILITTHDEDELSLCNRMFLLNKGSICEREASLRGSELLGLLR